MVMKYAEQGSLHDYLKNHKDKLSWDDKLKLACQITEALDYIHDREVIHRDLHSGNILWVSRHGSNEFVDVAPFARDDHDSLYPPITIVSLPQEGRSLRTLG